MRWPTKLVLRNTSHDRSWALYCSFWKVSMVLTWLVNTHARLWSHRARSEWSGPSDFSPISIACLNRESASANFSWFR